jgi:hypothetical protein
MTDTERIIELEKQVLAYEAIIARKSDELTALTNAANLFERVMTISHVYVTRFGGRLTEEGSVEKVNEEIDEFKTEFRRILFRLANDAANISVDYAFPPLEEQRKDAAGELFDCLVTLGGMAAFIGLDWSMMNQAMRNGLKRLEDRTEEHYIWHEPSKTVMRKDKIAKGETK